MAWDPQPRNRSGQLVMRFLIRRAFIEHVFSYRSFFRNWRLGAGRFLSMPSVHKERVFSHGDSLPPFAENRKVACNSPITWSGRSGPMDTGTSLQETEMVWNVHKSKSCSC